MTSAAPPAQISYMDLLDAWDRAAARTKQRHRSLTHLQKRGGRKGSRTQRVRFDFMRLTLENRIRVDELFPRAWRERMTSLTQLADQDCRVDLVIGEPVLVEVRK